MPPVGGRELRRVMGHFATGIALMTTQAGRDMHGMTVNALTSLSLDPPLVLVCLQKAARMTDLVRASGSFALNFLSEDHAALSDHYAGRPIPPGEAHFVPWQGGPRLTSAIAALALGLERMVEAGDHTIAIGRVVAVHEGDPSQKPLLFFRGRYGDFREREALRRAPALQFGGSAHLIYYDPSEESTWK